MHEGTLMHGGAGTPTMAISRSSSLQAFLLGDKSCEPFPDDDWIAAFSSDCRGGRAILAAITGMSPSEGTGQLQLLKGYIPTPRGTLE